MSLLDTITKAVGQKATIIEKRQIADHTFHLKIQGSALQALTYTPGEHLRVLIGLDKNSSLMDKVRTYSIWQYDQANATIDLAVCTHSKGVGSRWIQEVQPGELLYFVGPRGNFTIDDSGDYYVFVGDPSALAHLYEINRNLSGSKKIISFIYADQDMDFFPDVDGCTPFSFYQQPQNPAQTVIEQLTSQVNNATGKGMLYVGGDSRLCATLNRYFRHSLHWGSRQIKTKPFWNPTKTGLS
ncbi:siderophore-interacting protein [Spirosoma oryzicola]|uniref:siderophore-interacting protein n=1 Tax=Spirosoma oryzicola TaxID=2898794 RepID=UPI001E3DFC58|nr:siderophore-interacting protein [Spirosoma oryzicola]UHG89620.1 siderophore-interacting protein [Spirosoma oryzicola]